MLRNHFDGGFRSDGGIQVALERVNEIVKFAANIFVEVDKFVDSVGVAFGNLRDVLSPLLPIFTVADTFDHAGIEEIFPRAEIKDALNGFAVVVADVVGSGDCDMFAFAVEFNFFDKDVDAFIVSAQSVEHVPNGSVLRAFRQNFFGIFFERHDDGNNYVAVFFIGSLAHDTSDSLNDIDLRTFA